MNRIEEIAEISLNPSFHLATIKLLEETDMNRISIKAELFNEYKTQVNSYISNVGINRSSQYTDELNELKDFRSDCLMSLVYAIRSAEKHPNKDIQKAGELLLKEIEPFVGAQKQSDNKFVASIVSIKETLYKESFMPSTTMLNLKEILDPMIKANTETIELTQKRAMEKNRPKVEELRLACNETYRKIVLIAQSSVVINPSEEGEQFILEMNTLINQAKLAEKQRKALASKKHSDDSTMEEDIAEIKSDVAVIREELI